MLKRRKIRKVRDARQADHGNVDEPRLLTSPEAFAQAVLIVNIHREVRHNARHGNAAELLEHFKPRLQNCAVAAEFVDNDALDALFVLFALQRHRTVELGEHAAAVDVSHQQHRRVHHAGKPHVDNVIFLQIDLCGATRPLDHNNIVLPAEALVCLHHRRDKITFSAIVFHRWHIALHAPVDDDLTADVRRRLEQDRVHARVRLDARSLGLHHLCAPHLSAIFRDEGVERHVLALEGRNTITVLLQNTAKPRGKQALARVGHRALDHNILCHALTPPPRF